MLPNLLGRVWAEWIELEETLANFQAGSSKEMSDDKGSDDISCSVVTVP